MSYRYTIFDKLVFYLSYFFYKLILPFEVRHPRGRMMIYELVYTLNKFIRYDSSYPYPYKDRMIQTRFGKFKIRPRTSDAANVSPAFERRDINHLIRLTRSLQAQAKKTTFLDVGGDIGTYSILMGNRFPGLNITCFEPISQSIKLIKENLELNGLSERVQLMPYALGNIEGKEVEIALNVAAPGSSTATIDEKMSLDERAFQIEKFKIRTLDKNILPLLDGFDAVIMKIDVEGMEQAVLEGARSLLKSGKEIYIMVEDFIDKNIIEWLERSGARFEGKYTEYNSWWSIHH